MSGPSSFSVELPQTPPQVFNDPQQQAQLRALYNAIDILRQRLSAEITEIELTPGPAGIDGIDGTDGVDGIDGTNGVDGTNGIDGTDGIDGTSAGFTPTFLEIDEIYSIPDKKQALIARPIIGSAGSTITGGFYSVLASVN